MMPIYRSSLIYSAGRAVSNHSLSALDDTDEFITVGGPKGGQPYLQPFARRYHLSGLCAAGRGEGERLMQSTPCIDLDYEGISKNNIGWRPDNNLYIYAQV